MNTIITLTASKKPSSQWTDDCNKEDADSDSCLSQCPNDTKTLNWQYVTRCVPCYWFPNYSYVLLHFKKWRTWNRSTRHVFAFACYSLGTMNGTDLLAYTAWRGLVLWDAEPKDTYLAVKSARWPQWPDLRAGLPALRNGLREWPGTGPLSPQA